MSPDDHVTGLLALVIGLAMSLAPALVLGIFWGPRLWRLRGGGYGYPTGPLAGGAEQQ